MKLVAKTKDLEKITLFRLLAFTGARKGEILALEWSDWNDNTLDINKAITRGFAGEEIGNTKTVSSNRLISLDKKTKSILKKWRKQNPDTKYIFENEFKKISESEESRLFSKEIFISNLKSRHLLNFNEVKEKLMELFN